MDDKQKKEMQAVITSYLLDNLELERFDVKCDEENNPQERLDQGFITCDIIPRFKMRRISLSDARLIWSLLPDWLKAQPKGMCPTQYGTGSQETDKRLSDQIKGILFGDKKNWPEEGK